MDYLRVKNNLEKFIRESVGPLALKGFHDSNKEISSKKDTISKREDVLTKYDEMINSMILEHILKEFPGISIMSEEAPEIPYDSKEMFIIDPIDGTKDFIRGREHFQIGIGIAKNMETECSLTFHPGRQELYWAIKGMGAYCNQKRIQVSSRDFPRSYVYLRSSDKRYMLPIFVNLVNNVENIDDDFATHYQICQIAKGLADGQIVMGAKPWDYCQYLIIEEAGGKVSDWKGDKFDVSKNNAVMSNSRIHNNLLLTIPKEFKEPNGKSKNDFRKAYIKALFKSFSDV